MIEVLPERDKDALKKRYDKVGIELCEGASAVVARCKDEELGECLFTLTSDKLTVLHLEPQDDIPLADGILRSALHVGVNAEVMDAFYAETAPEELLKKLGFIGEEPKSILVDKLFRSCSCGK